MISRGVIVMPAVSLTSAIRPAPSQHFSIRALDATLGAEGDVGRRYFLKSATPIQVTASASSAACIPVQTLNGYAYGGYPESVDGYAESAHVHEYGYVHQPRSTQTHVRAGDAHRERGDGHASAVHAGARARGFR